MQEVDNILRILEETRESLEEHNPFKIRNLSDQTVHSATIYQDEDNIEVAVTVYAISKILERENYKEMAGWKDFYKRLIKNLDGAIEHLKENKIEKAMDHFRDIRDDVEKISGHLKEYILDVFRKAEINKASRIYEHGLSMPRTAELLGLSQWELSSYIGQSSSTEMNLNETKAVEKRIKLAQEAFK